MASANANTGIPGYVMMQGIFHSADPVRWTIVAMLVCISIEGFIYLYFRLFRHPFVASVASNVASLIAGYPVSSMTARFMDSAGIYDGVLMGVFFLLVPTMLSILIEGVIIKPFCQQAPRRFWMIVIGANVLTNAIMFTYIVMHSTGRVSE
jgi:hypothetical protein